MNNLLKPFLLGTVAVLALTGCKKDNGPDLEGDGDSKGRWITVAGALMQDEPGDGNGGTMVATLNFEDAKNPNVSVNVFDESLGFHVKSNRTARLQASSDGNILYNIQYTGPDGGIFNKYRVNGGKRFTEFGVPVTIAPYAGTSPRWAKVNEGLGIAVNVALNPTLGVADEFLYARGQATVLALDLNDPKIKGYKQYPLALSPQEEAAGYSIFRLDAPILNKKGDKVLIGTWMRKYNVNSLTYEDGQPVYSTDATSPRLGTKTIVVDYPSLQNPKIITSTEATGDNSGYRSPMSYLAEDGSIYQATHREIKGTGGSKILKITTGNEYDNTYSLSLDNALGVTDSYIYTWTYVGDGIGYVLYRLEGEEAQDYPGYVARIDLINKTAQKISIPGNPKVDFGQHQGIAVVGNEVFIPVVPTGQDGNLYIFDKDGNVTTGARLINRPGNRYIGSY